MRRSKRPPANGWNVGKTITFLASLPPIPSAITLDGNGDGARIKLDLPATDTGAALLLQHQGAGKLLQVTIQVVEDGKENPKSTRRFS